jgi:hypothetical protein
MNTNSALVLAMHDERCCKCPLGLAAAPDMRNTIHPSMSAMYHRQHTTTAAAAAGALTGSGKASFKSCAT